MVRITKLDLQGFKSFAHKTAVNFPSDFSIVCGPNGSGKSNILDAIVFVLGRSSAKSMRAGKMLEMIFNGGANRKPAEVAKVGLHFDNKTRVFPVDDDEVVISRAVNRRGVSIYKLNGQTVTREKIREVMRVANIHPDGHNIILQGDITEIIEMSSVQRREILDEISGIREFDEKKEKAQRELATVGDRLEKTSIVLQEREKIMEKLQVEKNAAENYFKLEKELDSLRMSVAATRLNDAQSSMKQLEGKVSAKEEEFKQASETLIGFDKTLEEKENELTSIGDVLIDRSKDIQLVREIEQIRSDLLSKQSKIESNRSNITRLDDIISRLEYYQRKQLEGNVSKPVQEILKLNRSGVVGTIGSLMKIDSKHQTAIEVCAGGHMQDIVVQEQSIAIDCVNHLKKNRIGRATFLPLDKIRERKNEHLKRYLKHPGVLGFAIDLIDFDKRNWHAFSFIFGDTLVVDTIETARSIGVGNARFVTLTGDLAEKSGAIIGGFYHRGKPMDTGGAKEIERYTREKKSLEEEIEIFGEDVVILKAKSEGLSQKEAEGSTELTEMQKKRIEIEKELDKTKKQRRSIYDKVSIAQEQVSRLKQNRARLEAELENLDREFADFSSKKGKIVEMDINSMEARIKEIVIETRTLGAINQKAVEEYDQIKSAYDELKSKVDTLSSEKDRVLSMMDEIEGKRRDSFQETLRAVSEQFRTVYKDLSSGEGFLRLETYATEDGVSSLENSGLVIEASPPGRRVLNMDLMSGGEKTLTALAFLFAVQQFRPAPFYVLDEIDAALDKPNTKKMNDLIKKYSSTAQFIVISHNDTTIQSADCVYGVSMNDGVSKLIGIKMPGE